MPTNKETEGVIGPVLFMSLLLDRIRLVVFNFTFFLVAIELFKICDNRTLHPPDGREGGVVVTVIATVQCRTPSVSLPLSAHPIYLYGISPFTIFVK